jgi:hypothetical protein
MSNPLVFLPFVGCLAVMVLTFVLAIINAYRTRRRVESLKASGLRVPGTVLAVEQRYRSKSSVKPEYRVVARGNDPRTGSLRTYTGIWFTTQPSTWQGDPVTIYVDPKNPDKFTVGEQ